MSPRSTVRQLLSNTAGALLLLVGISSAAIAEDVLLNSDKVAAHSSDLVLIRTSMTPSKVELSLPVAMGNTVCAEYGQVQRSGYDSFRCGTHGEVRHVCREEGRVCSRDRRGREHCTTARRCYNEVIQVANFCSWTETVCVRHEVETSSQIRKVTLKFKKMARLAQGETETFELRAQQTHVDGSDALFDLTALQTKRPVKINEKDGVFTGFKDVVTIKGD
jgi:hypothetical protein